VIKLFVSKNDNLYDKVKELFKSLFNQENVEIAFTENGKPYAVIGDIKSNYYFSLSHCDNFGVIAISDREIGVDCEKICERKTEKIIQSFSLLERESIKTLKDFYINWTAKESFIKHFGFTIASTLKNLRFVDGQMTLNGKEVDKNFLHFTIDEHVVCICSDCETAEISYL